MTRVTTLQGLHEAVRWRIRHLLTVELDRRVTLMVKRLPEHCVHNYRHPLDVRKTVDGHPNEQYNRISLPVVQQTIGLCTLGKDTPAEWNGTICEDPVDAQRCPYFNGKQTKESVLREFEEQLRDMNWVSQNLPEVHGLLWVLEYEPVRLPWWKRVWFWVLKIHPEPLKQLPRRGGEDDPLSF